MKILKIYLSAGLLSVCLDSHAHHTASLYAQDEKITITGKVTRYDWRNPHVYLWVEGTSNAGVTAVWEIEGQPPTMLKRLGWSKETLDKGETVVVTGWPGRDPGQPVALMTSLEKADNTVMDMSLQAMFSTLSANTTPASASAAGLAGTWVTLFNFPAVLQFADTTGLPRTAAGIAAVERYVEQEDSPALDCIPGPSPLLMLTPDVKQIEVTGETMVIRGELDNSSRTIHLDRDSHKDGTESVQGDAIGHWEGDTLVIDTTLFSPNPVGNGSGLPSGPDKHLVERLRLDESGTLIHYSFTLADPEFLTTPVTGEAQWAYQPDIEFEALPCDLENARRFSR